MRIKVNIHTLTGHTNTVASVVCQAAKLHVFKYDLTLVISNFHFTFANYRLLQASHDSTLRLWDLTAGKSMSSNESQEKCPGSRNVP